MNLAISHLQQAYRDGSLEPSTLIDYILDRCSEFTAGNIWITLLTREQLEPWLQRLQDMDPQHCPLWGIPFAIKDNIDLAGIATTAACADFSYVPEQSAFVVQRLIEAGAIPIGKTNMDQFATGLVGTRSPWGACANAFDRNYISGGSSSGSAVAVSLGLVSFALGTDTAGSGRVPAAFNNIVGLKPSKGLLSTSGVVPACRSLDCVSIFTLTTDDAELLLDITARYDDADDYARADTAAADGESYGLPEGGFRFAVPHAGQLEFFGNAQTPALFAEACARMQALGGEMVEIDFTPFLDAARLLYEGPWVSERYLVIADRVDQKPETLLPEIYAIIGGGRDRSAAEAFAAAYRLAHCKRLTDAVLQQVDFLLTPTAGTHHTIEQVQADPIRLNSQLGYYTNFMNLLDYSGLAMPAGFGSDGLPFGITLVADAMKDRRLLSFGRRWQEHLNLPMGRTGLRPQFRPLPARQDPERTAIAVCGAHLQGQPLNRQLTERGARLLRADHTAACYRLYALPDGRRPGLVRAEDGATIEVEVWSLPTRALGSFLRLIAHPLGLGQVELADGSWVCGFICEAGLKQATDITHFGGWRAYLKQKSGDQSS